MRRAGPSRGGFTLLEVLVALAVVAIALLALARVQAAAARAERTATQRRALAARATAELRLQRALSGGPCRLPAAGAATACRVERRCLVAAPPAGPPCPLEAIEVRVDAALGPELVVRTVASRALERLERVPWP